MTPWMAFALAGYVAAAFALPSEAASSLVFYVGTLPAAALAWRRVRLRGGEALVLALIVWSGLTLCWGEDDGQRSLKCLLGALATAAFVLALLMVLDAAAWRRQFASLLVVAGGGNAVFVLLANAPGLLRGERILGWGVTKQPILGGSVMSAVCITAVFAGLDRGRLRPAYAAAALVMAGFVLAMQSRGALAGFAGALLLAVGCRWKWRGVASCCAAAAAFLAVTPEALRRPVLIGLLARGTSHRLEIWAASWALIKERPLFGHGLAANLPVSPTGFPHSLFLSLLFYSGAVGLLLFMALAGLVTWRILHAARGAERAWVAALWINSLVAGVTDFGQITKGPGPLWLILWVPIVLALRLPVGRRAEGPVHWPEAS